MTNADTAMYFWQPNNYKKRLSCDRCYIELRSALPGRGVEETDPRAKAACKRVTGPLPDGAAGGRTGLGIRGRPRATVRNGAPVGAAWPLCAGAGKASGAGTAAGASKAARCRYGRNIQSKNFTLRFSGQHRSTNSRVGKDEGMLGAFSSWHWRNTNADNAAWLCPKPFLSKAVAHVRPSSTCWIASYTTGRNWAIVSLPSAVAARRLWYLARKRSLYCKNACVPSGWRSQVSPAGTTMGQMPWAAQH